MARSDLFPPLEPIQHGMLPVDGGHVLYFEECGTQNGIPVVFLHGGPGAGATPNHRRFFDPDAYRIVIFDQRGAGRSLPTASVDGNTTADLVADIERVRAHLGIDKWLIFGGSWGSTLGLAYAQAHADRCLGLVLRGIFLGSDDEIHWFLHGIRKFFPEAWQRFVDFLPEVERSDLLLHYHRRLVDPDPAVHLPAARVWSAYEAACSTLMPNPAGSGGFTDDPAALAIARL